MPRVVGRHARGVALRAHASHADGQELAAAPRRSRERGYAASRADGLEIGGEVFHVGRERLGRRRDGSHGPRLVCAGREQERERDAVHGPS